MGHKLHIFQLFLLSCEQTRIKTADIKFFIPRESSFFFVLFFLITLALNFFFSSYALYPISVLHYISSINFLSSYSSCHTHTNCRCYYFCLLTWTLILITVCAWKATSQAHTNIRRKKGFMWQLHTHAEKKKEWKI